MKILFISNHKYPHIGGVEKHIFEVEERLRSRGHIVKVISSEDIEPKNVKLFGLLNIWLWLFKNKKYIEESDIIQIHDVFIWYLPFVFIYPFKKVYTTHHGWEGKYPIPLWNILNKRISNKLVKGSISVGSYIDKYYGIKSNIYIYGGVNETKLSFKKVKNSIIYLGRLEKDTGIIKFFKWLEENDFKHTVTFVGDGSLRNTCKKYGDVVGNTFNINKYLDQAEYCVPAGYLSYLEALSRKCKIITFADNPLKEDYWKEIKKIKNTLPSWDDVTNKYIKLWSIK